MLTTTALLLTLSGTPVAFNEPPPPPPIEQVSPRPGWVWVEGGYEWRHGRYRPLPGHWERERTDRRWRTGRWYWRGNHYEWIPGGWVSAPPPPPLPPPPPPPPVRRGFPGIVIAGRIVDQWGRPVPGITVVLAGRSEARVLTDGDGRYAFTGLAPGSYAVRPTEPRCGFGPDVMNLNNLGSNAVQNFTANCR
jgi:hypothetical protein